MEAPCAGDICVFRDQKRSNMTHTHNAILHWLRLPERVNFKLAVMAYRVLHGRPMAPEYLNQLVLVSDLPSRHRLRSSSTLHTARSTIPSDDHRPSLVSCCSIHRLELIACLPPVFTISLHVLTTAEDVSLSAVISRHPHLTSLHYAIVDFVMAICHFSHVKNIDWFSGWLVNALYGPKFAKLFSTHAQEICHFATPFSIRHLVLFRTADIHDQVEHYA